MVDEAQVGQRPPAAVGSLPGEPPGDGRGGLGATSGARPVGRRIGVTTGRGRRPRVVDAASIRRAWTVAVHRHRPVAGVEDEVDRARGERHGETSVIVGDRHRSPPPKVDPPLPDLLPVFPERRPLIPPNLNPPDLLVPTVFRWGTAGTVTATAVLRGQGRPGKKHGQKRRRVVDQAAAVVILQNALDTERSTGTPPGEIVEPIERGPA